jgi:predicted RecB family nuclease
MATLALLGEQHESRQRKQLAPYLDLKVGSPDDRIARTREALRGEDHEVLYQPLLLGKTRLADKEREIVGEPDFLVRQNDEWVVREVKLARRVEGGHHAEIRLQVECYGWLLEQTTGRAPGDLEIVLGDGETLRTPYQGGEGALEILDRLVRIEEGGSYGYEPVGWSKCSRCVFHDVCWKAAKKRNDVSLVPDLDQGLARELHTRGIRTVRDLIRDFDEEQLARLDRPYGRGRRKVGKAAGGLLRAAEALTLRRDLRVGALDLPRATHYAIFDIEGVPPDLEDDVGRIFLWGIKVFGERPSEFLYSLAGFDAGSDRRAWFEFLRLVRKLYDAYGTSLLLVHWAPYEVGKVRSYLERYGDEDTGTASRILDSLFDLLPCTKRTWALPLHSYSLKVVERHAGYRRKLPEANGAWAIAKYIEAVETEDEEQRQAHMGEILEYNEEDLDATWRILTWLLEKEGLEVPGGRES